MCPLVISASSSAVHYGKLLDSDILLTIKVIKQVFPNTREAGRIKNYAVRASKTSDGLTQTSAAATAARWRRYKCQDVGR